MKSTITCAMTVSALLSLPALAQDAAAAKLAVPAAAEAAPAVQLPARVILHRWSLADVKGIALKQNPSLQAAMQRVEAAAASVELARAAYYPRLDLVAGATRVQETAGRGMPSGAPFTMFSGGAEVSWVVFDGFRRKFSVLAAHYGHEAGMESYRDGQRLLLQAVSMTFYNALLAQEAMAISREDADFNQLLLEDARKRFDAGVAGRSEVLNFEVRRGQAEAQFIEAEKSWQIACVALGELLSMPGEDLGQYTELLPTPAPAAGTGPQLGAELAYAMVNRPDIRRADRQIDLAKARIDIARAGNLPQVSVFGNYGWERQNSFSLNHKSDQNASFGMVARWNLFAGGADRESIRISEFESLAEVKTKEALQLQIEAELRQGFAAFKASRRQMELQDNISKLAIQIRDLVRQEYLAGTATITRLNEAQTDLVKAASALSQARIRLLLNLEDISASSGHILDSVPAAAPDTKEAVGTIH